MSHFKSMSLIACYKRINQLDVPSQHRILTFSRKIQPIKSLTGLNCEEAVLFSLFISFSFFFVKYYPLGSFLLPSTVTSRGVAVSCGYDTCFLVKACDGLCQLQGGHGLSGPSEKGKRALT